MVIGNMHSVEEEEKRKDSVSDAIEEISEDEFKRLSSGNLNPKKSSRQQEPPKVMRKPSFYHVPANYASSLFSLAWAQAVRDEPREVVLESKLDSESKQLSSRKDGDGIPGAISLETPAREGCDRIVIDLDDDSPAEEGNGRVVIIDLEIDDVVVDDDMIVDVDSMMDDVRIVSGKLEDSAIGLATVDVQCSKESDTLMEDSELLTIVLELEALTVDKAEKSFGNVCTRVHDLLVNLQEVISDSSDSDTGSWKYISFAALQTINSAFHSLSSNQKVQHKSIHQRLLSYVKRHNPAMFLPAQIREIEIMVQDLDKSPALLNSTDNKKKDFIRVSEICSDKKLETSELGSTPVLDLHKDHDVVRLPTIEKNKTKEPVIAIENITIHPCETHAVKQNFKPSSILIPEKIPCPTLLNGSDDGIRDAAGEVSRTSSASMPPEKLRNPQLRSGPGDATMSRKHKPVKDPVSDVPVVKRRRQGLENVQMVSDVNSGHQQLHGRRRQVENMDETGKICMKPGDPSHQKVLQSRSQNEKCLNDQSVTGSMLSLLEPMPNISRKVTSKQKNNIVSVTQPSLEGHYSHMDVAQLQGYSEKQIATIQKERTRRIREQKELFSARKLSLVLDLDHTLLNSTRFAELDSVYEEFLRKKEEQDRGNPNRLLFRIPHMGMWTKLRPGIWNFLEKASKLFELHLNTLGNKKYATEMAKLLDPTGVLFAGRIMSRGDDDPVCPEERFSKTKDLHGVLGLESNTIIIDDTTWVWPNNKLNLIAVERYMYFPCSRRQFGLLGPSLLEIDRDERNENGTIASLLAVIKRIHETFFSEKSLREVDVRNILSSHQRKILSGCCIVFSRVIPIGANPHKHPLWQIAEQFGAQCTNQIDDKVTHVVANGPGTDKVNWALSTGRFVVNPGWVEASAFLYRKAKEKEYSIFV